jgi:hypothetical protein
MNPERNEDLMRQLAALPPCDLDPGAAARIRNVAWSVLQTHHRAAAAQTPDWISKLWSDTVESAFVLAASASLLTWAVHTALTMRG